MLFQKIMERRDEAHKVLKETIFLLGWVVAFLFIIAMVLSWPSNFYDYTTIGMRIMLVIGCLVTWFFILWVFYAISKEKTPEKIEYDKKLKELKEKYPVYDVREYHRKILYAEYLLKKRKRELKEAKLNGV